MTGWRLRQVSMPLRVFSVAVASGRAGWVLLQGDQLIDWGILRDATKSSNELVGTIQALINRLTPDVMVTEQPRPGGRKGAKTRQLISAVTTLASHNSVLDVCVPRPRRFPTKFDEAVALAKRHPELAGHVPKHKRRCFDYEPRSMILFEALALAEDVIHGPPEQLAAAMG